jgi:hypothetical protein
MCIPYSDPFYHDSHSYISPFVTHTAQPSFIPSSTIPPCTDLPNSRYNQAQANVDVTPSVYTSGTSSLDVAPMMNSASPITELENAQLSPMPTLPLYQCQWAECKRLFAPSQRAIREHFDQYHPIPPRKIYRVCRWRGCDKPEMKDFMTHPYRHLCTHIPVQRYRCDLCKKTLGRMDNLLRHRRGRKCSKPKLGANS